MALGHDTPLIIMEKIIERKEEVFNRDSPASYRLNTMIPFDVFTNLIRFCKKNVSTGLGKFDFGTGIRVLLMKSEYADMIYDLDNRLIALENKIENKSQSEDKPTIPKGCYEVKTFGIANKINEGDGEDNA
jgi:hypothetical protein